MCFFSSFNRRLYKRWFQLNRCVSSSIFVVVADSIDMLFSSAYCAFVSNRCFTFENVLGSSLNSVKVSRFIFIYMRHTQNIICIRFEAIILIYCWNDRVGAVRSFWFRLLCDLHVCSLGALALSSFWGYAYVCRCVHGMNNNIIAFYYVDFARSVFKMPYLIFVYSIWIQQQQQKREAVVDVGACQLDV